MRNTEYFVWLTIFYIISTGKYDFLSVIIVVVVVVVISNDF